MNSLSKVLTAVILFAVSINSWAQQVDSAGGAPECRNGAIYKTCEDQRKLYKDLLTQMTEVNKQELLLVIFGYDACPWCVSLNRILRSDEGQAFLREKKLRLLEIGVFDPKMKAVLSGYRVMFQVTLQSIDSPRSTLGGQEAYPMMALVNPRTKSSVLIETGDLEENTPTSKGHDFRKIQQTLLNASVKLGAR
jgi:hypothetical protein